MSTYQIVQQFKQRMTAIAAEVIEESRDDVLAEALLDLNEARFKIVNRVRRGKVERRKKVSTQKGYTFRGGKLEKMSAAERMRRKVSQRRGAKKRAAKQSRINRVKTKALRIRKRTFGEEQS